jgi:hypothetical protein
MRRHLATLSAVTRNVSESKLEAQRLGRPEGGQLQMIRKLKSGSKQLPAR